MSVSKGSSTLYFLFPDSSVTNRIIVKLITSFLLSYPLAGLLKRVPDEKPYLKNLFIIAQVSFHTARRNPC